METISMKKPFLLFTRVLVLWGILWSSVLAQDNISDSSSIQKPDSVQASKADSLIAEKKTKPESLVISDTTKDSLRDSLLWKQSSAKDSLQLDSIRLSKTPKQLTPAITDTLAKDSSAKLSADSSIAQDSAKTKDSPSTLTSSPKPKKDSLKAENVSKPKEELVKKPIPIKDSIKSFKKPESKKTEPAITKTKPALPKNPPKDKAAIVKENPKKEKSSPSSIKKADSSLQPMPKEELVKKPIPIKDSIKSYKKPERFKADSQVVKGEPAQKKTSPKDSVKKAKPDTIASVSSLAQPSDNAAPENEADVITQLKSKLTQDVPNIPWKLSVGKILWAILTFFIGLFIIRYITKIFNLLAENWAAYRIQIKGLLPIFRILGWAFILYIIIAGILHPPIETILAMTASVGLAVGISSQDILKNIFGGIVILMDRPFTVGDKIEIGKYYGEVTSIGIRTTRLQTADDSMIAIPNSELMNSSLSNSNSGEHDCQVVAEFYLPLNVDLAKIKAMAIKSAGISRYIYLKKPIAVIFKNEIHQGKSLLKMRLKAYVFDHRYEPAFMSEMTEIFLRQLEQHNIWEG